MFYFISSSFQRRRSLFLYHPALPASFQTCTHQLFFLTVRFAILTWLDLFLSLFIKPTTKTCECVCTYGLYHLKITRQPFTLLSLMNFLKDTPTCPDSTYSWPSCSARRASHRTAETSCAHQGHGYLCIALRILSFLAPD